MSDPWARFPNVEEDPWGRFPNVDPSVLNALQSNTPASSALKKPWPFVDARLPSTLPWLANAPTAYTPIDYPPADENWAASKFGLFGRGPVSQPSPSLPLYPAPAAADTMPNPPTLSFDPPATAAAPIRGKSVLTDEQIRNIVFNETRGLQSREPSTTDDNLLSARVEMADTIMNADRKWGPRRSRLAGTAPMMLPAGVSEDANSDLSGAATAVRLARWEQANDLDSADGATNYTFRRLPGQGQPPVWPNSSRPHDVLTLHDVHGPFRHYVGVPRYFDSGNSYLYTWLNPAARR